MADEWNLNKPVDTTLISDLPSEHRARKTDTAAVIEKEHATLGDGNTGGEHKQGSAVMWHLSTANIPILQPDGAALTSSDNGRLWHDITTDIVYVLEDYNDPTIGTGWIAIGHYLGDIAINTDKFTVARATGNTDIDGTLDVVGAINPTTFAVTNGGFLDEDSMASDDATAVASQQSIKAFAEPKLVTQATAGIFGVRTANDSLSNALVINEVYKADSDGYVSFNTQMGNQGDVFFYSDSSNPPTTELAEVHGDWGAGDIPCTQLVRKNDYWKITYAGAGTVDLIYWLPIGTGACVKQ